MTRHFNTWNLLAFVISLTLLTGLTACGGGGGGGDDGGVGPSGAPILLRITMQGLATPLWQNVAGTPTPAPACPTDVPLNAQIFFTFGGTVDAASLPGAGQADGSIIISAVSGAQTIVAQGSFLVVDEPGLPLGNMQRVIFQPSLPNSPANPTAAGLNSGLQYTIFVPRAGSSPQVVRVAGQGLTSEAITCFIGCVIPPTGSATGCFVDSSPGSPFVVTTTPETGDPSPAPIDPGTINANTVSITISEALDPTSINTANVKLILAGAGFQVPGQVFFTQAGIDPALGIMSKIDYVASAQLLSSATYEIQFTSAVTDFGGNTIDLQQSNPSAQRFFDTVAVPFCAQAPLIEDFASTSNRGVVGTPLVWDGSGQLITTFPNEVFGDASDGNVTFSLAASPHNIDTAAIAAGSPGFEGIWNALDLIVEPGATLNITGPWPVHFRCQGAVTIGAGATILGNAVAPDGGAGEPWRGGLNNNSPTPGGTGNFVVFGGKGGPGGGLGGDASQEGNPDRTAVADIGDGASAGGTPGLNPVDPFYGPGEGGEGHQQVQAVIGAGGGAGGSSYGQGGVGTPLNGVNSSGLCGAPLTGPQVTLAVPTPAPVGFLPPLSKVSGGSGGGGGGDRFDLVTLTINLDDQGGAGGGGGGGIRISSVGNIDILAGARVEMNGATGNNCVSLGSGAGGSGSGGMIWLQTISDVNIDPSANMQVHGGVCPTGSTGLLNYRCAGAPGLGGEGIYQFEDGDGLVAIGFQGATAQAAPSSCGTNQTDPNPLPGGIQGAANNIAVFPFPFSGNIGNTATSTFLDTGYGAPTYMNADPGDEVFTLGTVPGASVIIRYQGAPEEFSSPGTPSTNPSTYSPWVLGNAIDTLSGFRFIRFEARLEYASPPYAAPISSFTFPAVQMIQIDYTSPLGCP